MNYYELTYLLNPNIEEPKSSVEDLVEIIEEDAEVDSKSQLEEIELGSPIKPKLGEESLPTALSGTVDFYSKPEKVNDLKEKIKQRKEVLRVMIVSKKEETTEPETEVETEQNEEEDKKVELEDIDEKLDEILEE